MCEIPKEEGKRTILYNYDIELVEVEGLQHIILSSPYGTKLTFDPKVSDVCDAIIKSKQFEVKKMNDNFDKGFAKFQTKEKEEK